MAPASAPVLLLAAAAMALQLSTAAAAAPPPAPAPIGLPGCDTTCGNVSVPYPFGYGPSHCYWPGLNLTCDRSHQPPRLLLLGDGSLRVAEISLAGEFVRVMRTGSIINTTGDFTSDGWNASLELGSGFREHGYQLSSQINELVVAGCNVIATISADVVGEKNPKIVSGCASLCTKTDSGDVYFGEADRSCTGTSGCCLAPLTAGGVPKPNGVQARWLYSGNDHTAEQTALPVTVFIAEQGWAEKELEQTGRFQFQEAPLLLDFAVTQGLPPYGEGNSSCSQDVQRMVCKSEHSSCNPRDLGYTCDCENGYAGNPYIAGGCQDIDECKFPGKEKVCFGVCINTMGSYDCQCPQGTYGDPGVEGGCVYYNFDDTEAVSPSNCSTSCGAVSVPYPFGFGASHCYWPGLNLTCDTRHSPPRLLLDSNSALQVVHISLHNSTVHVIHHHSSHDFKNNTVANDDGGPFSPMGMTNVGLPDIGDPYVLSTRNEFIVISNWHLRGATLYGEYRNGLSNTDSIISRAVCSSGSPVGDRGYCSGYHGCCHAPISAGSTPKRVEFEVLSSRDNSSLNIVTYAFISEMGLTDEWHQIFNMNDQNNFISSPVVLQWAVKKGLSMSAADSSGKCPAGVASSLCQSENSDCRQENGGFTCHCSNGFDGNPYVAHGCHEYRY